MSKASEALQRRFGANLSESLGVRSPGSGVPPLPRPGSLASLPSSPSGPSPSPAPFPRESGPDEGRTRARDAGHMELTRIVPDPDQPRKEFDDDAVARLSASLLKHGQLMPIRVRWNPDLSKWVVISGERRYRAALRAGLKTVACIFAQDGLTQSEILQEQIVENLLREDLRPVEQARAYRQLMDLHGWSAKDLAGELQVSQGAVSKSLALLSLPVEVQEQVEAGELPATTAYEVARMADPDLQRDVARRVVTEGLNRQAATEVVREVAARPAQKREPRTNPKPAPTPAPPASTRTIATPLGRAVLTLAVADPTDDQWLALLQAAQAALRPPGGD